MRKVSFSVVTTWDDEAKVWYVSETDVPGLSTEAKTFEEMRDKLRVMIPELLILNGILKQPKKDRCIEVPFELMTRQFELARAGC